MKFHAALSSEEVARLAMPLRTYRIPDRDRAIWQIRKDHGAVNAARVRRFLEARARA